jgi:hypothetical protein
LSLLPDAVARHFLNQAHNRCDLRQLTVNRISLSLVNDPGAPAFRAFEGVKACR